MNTESGKQKSLYDTAYCKEYLHKISAEFTELSDGRLLIDGDLNLRRDPGQITHRPNLRHIFLTGSVICGKYQEGTLRALANVPVKVSTTNPEILLTLGTETPRPVDRKLFRRKP